jgi:hypothetical protein
MPPRQVATKTRGIIMHSETQVRSTAVIYSFPVKSRLATNKLAEQARRMREIESARTASVVSTSAWYHEEAMAEEATHQHSRRQ